MERHSPDVQVVSIKRGARADVHCLIWRARCDAISPVSSHKSTASSLHPRGHEWLIDDRESDGSMGQAGHVSTRVFDRNMPEHRLKLVKHTLPKF